MPQASHEQFARLAQALTSANSSVAEIFSAMSDEAEFSIPLSRLIELQADIVFRVAGEDGAPPPGQFDIVVTFEGSTRYEVVLPACYASLANALDHVTRTGHESVFDTRRLRDMIGVVLDMLTHQELQLVGAAASLPQLPRIKIPISIEDGCDDGISFALSRHHGSGNPLIPDPYYFANRGYHRHKANALRQMHSWSTRSDKVVWRGSTTGPRFSASDLLSNQRIRTASVCSTRPDLFDVKITGIVQLPEAEIEMARLELGKLGLLADWAPLDSLVTAKFALHIDGNASAAGFFEKLSLGCCVLHVQSDFQQWIDERATPWEHYVPIAKDLSDLVSKAEFLHRNSDLAERIARAGFRLALESDPDREAEEFFRKVAKFPAYELVLGAPGGHTDGRPIGSWYEVEQLPDGRKFRWTRSHRISWPVPPEACRATLLKVSLPIVGEIRPEFASACRLEFGGDLRPVTKTGGKLEAEFIPKEGVAISSVVLVTPPPLAPSNLTDSLDRRTLGLAAQVTYSTEGIDSAGLRINHTGNGDALLLAGRRA